MQQQKAVAIGRIKTKAIRGTDILNFKPFTMPQLYSPPPVVTRKIVGPKSSHLFMRALKGS